MGQKQITIELLNNNQKIFKLTSILHHRSYKTKDLQAYFVTLFIFKTYL